LPVSDSLPVLDSCQVGSRPGAVRSPVSCSCCSQRCYVRVWWHCGSQRPTTRHLSVPGTFKYRLF